MEDNKDIKHSVEHEDEEDSKIFPQKLMEILADDDNAEAICWLPHGKAFTIRNRGLFTENIMPKFFPRKAKYSSFTRKLNRWNFVRVASGPELGAYYHEFFLRDKPQLAAQMFCKNARSKLAMANDAMAPLHVSNPESSTILEKIKPAEEDTVCNIAPISNIPPSVLAALLKDEQKESCLGYKSATAPVLGLSGLQLLVTNSRFCRKNKHKRSVSTFNKWLRNSNLWRIKCNSSTCANCSKIPLRRTRNRCCICDGTWNFVPSNEKGKCPGTDARRLPKSLRPCLAPFLSSGDLVLFSIALGCVVECQVRVEILCFMMF